MSLRMLSKMERSTKSPEETSGQKKPGLPESFIPPPRDLSELIGSIDILLEQKKLAVKDGHLLTVYGTGLVMAGEIYVQQQFPDILPDKPTDYDLQVFADMTRRVVDKAFDNHHKYQPFRFLMKMLNEDSLLRFKERLEEYESS